MDATDSHREALDVDDDILPVHRYKPLELLGQGALGRVYLCQDRKLGKTVAVKSLLSITDDRVVSFQNEAKIASKLNHESVIKILDFGITSSGRPFMVMEYFPNRSLAEVIEEQGCLEETDALSLFVSIAEALACLHASNVFHRDLKPSNILLGTTDPSVRLIDFNLSKTSQNVQSKTFVQGRTVVGTPAYMSPDQVAGQPYDARSEIYSMGCLMYEVLTGHPPYEGETALEVLNLHANGTLVPPRERVPDLSDETSAIVEQCLRKSRDQRYSSMRDLISALNHARSHLNVSTAYGAHVPTPPVTNNTNINFLVTACGLTLVIGAAVAYPILFKPPEKTFTPKEKEVDAFVRVNQVQLPDAFAENFSNCSELAAAAVKKGDTRVHLPYTCVDKDLKNLEGAPKIEELILLDGPGVTDASLKILETIPNLRILDFEGTNVSSLKGINKLKKLEVLSLNRTDIGDASIPNLAGLDNLRTLRLGHNDITDRGIEALPPLCSLSDIGIETTKVTDAGLLSLAKHKKLTRLNLNFTGATPYGVRKLLAALPSLKVVDLGGNTNFSEAELKALTREFPKVSFDPKDVVDIQSIEKRANNYFAEQKYKEALILYERCLNRHPNILSPLTIRYKNCIIQCHDKLGNWTKAMQLAEELATSADKQGDAPTALAGYRVASEISLKRDAGRTRPKLAKDIVRVAEREYGNKTPTAEGSQILADAYLVDKQYDKAIQAYQRANQLLRQAGLEEGEVELLYNEFNLAEAYRHTYQFKLALAYYDKVLPWFSGKTSKNSSDDFKNVYFAALSARTQVLLDMKKVPEAFSSSGNALKHASLFPEHQISHLVKQRLLIAGALNRPTTEKRIRQEFHLEASRGQ